MAQIWERIARNNLGQIYSSRKIYPPAAWAQYTLIDGCLDLQIQVLKIFFNETEDRLGLWSTLNFILVCLGNHRFLQGVVGRMKEPHVSVPEQLWQGMDKEVGVFPDVVQQIIEVFSANDPHIPPFKRLLKIVCGGSLNNACVFCSKQIVVRAIYGQVGDVGGPTVFVQLYFPRVFNCGEKSCLEQSYSKMMLLQKWTAGVSAAASKLAPNICDFCYKFSEKVHRCDRCLTKIYCSKECLQQDLRGKHEAACKKESDQRKVKVKEERKARKEAEKTRADKKSAEVMKMYEDTVRLSSLCEDIKKTTLEAMEQVASAKNAKKK